MRVMIWIAIAVDLGIAGFSAFSKNTRMLGVGDDEFIHYVQIAGALALVQACIAVVAFIGLFRRRRTRSVMALVAALLGIGLFMSVLEYGVWFWPRWV